MARGFAPHAVYHVSKEKVMIRRASLFTLMTLLLYVGITSAQDRLGGRHLIEAETRKRKINRRTKLCNSTHTSSWMKARYEIVLPKAPAREAPLAVVPPAQGDP